MGIYSLGMACVLLAAPSARLFAASDTVTLRVPNADLPKLSRVKVLDRIDYGEFSIVEVSPADADALKSAKVRICIEDSGSIVGLQGHEFNTRTGPPAGRSDLTAVASPGTPAFYIVQFAGPIKPEWRGVIEQAGGRIVGYVPQNCYLVWMDPARVAELESNHVVKWTGLYQPQYKIAKDLDGAKGRIDYLSVVIYERGAGITVAKIEKLGAKFVRSMESPFSPDIPAVAVLFSADASLIPAIARLPRVVRIDRSSCAPGLDDEVAGQIVAGHRLNGIPYSKPSYTAWTQQAGYNGAGSKVAIVDTGCDTNDNSTAHPDLQGRLDTIIRYNPTTSPPTDISGHGTHVAGVIAGSGAVGTVDDEGFLYGLGIAPGAHLVILYAVSQGAPFPPGGQWSTLTKDAYNNGAFVSNNSWWLSDTPGRGYTAACATTDALVRDADPTAPGAQQLVMVFSAGNSGPGASTILEPKEAKNIITVGASENYRPAVTLGPTCGAANNIDGIASFSARGPCADGRIAPTVVAPGTSIASAKSRTTQDWSGCKSILDADYVWMSGTSQAAPMVSGTVALIGQWWRAAHSGSNPSPAMCKALIVNGADDIAGGPDGRGGYIDHIPSPDQGWGRLNVAATVNPPNPLYDDQSHVMTATGQSVSYQIQAADANKPLKITLAWTDAPGTIGSYGWANDLDLSASGSSGTYLGNVFQNGWSTLGGSRDYKNNVECVYIEHPSGTYTVTVTAANIVADGSTLQQDYALVMRNAGLDGTPPSIPSVTADSSYTTNLAQLGASWSATDPESGISKYEYAIGTSSGGTDTAFWTDTGVLTHVVRSDLTLALNQNYYFSVRATNGTGMQSQASSGPVLAAQTVADVGSAKTLGEDSGAVLATKTVSAAFSGRFYIQEIDRSSGIGVNWTGTVSEGGAVTVAGKIHKDPLTCERFIDAVDVR